MTNEEAIEQGILPFRVRLKFGPPPIFSEDEIRSAELAVGGFEGPEDLVELRYPSRPVAEETVRRLEELLPGTEWVISYADV